MAAVDAGAGQLEFCSRYATKQCDFPIIKDGKQKTCDATCVTGARSTGSWNRLCLPHHRNAKKIMEARLGVMADDIPEPEGLGEERTVER